MTPTEAGAVAGAYSLLIAFLVYRTLNLKSLGKIVVDTLRTTGTIFLVIAAAYAFSFIITSEQVSVALVNFTTQFISEPWQFMVVVNILFLILGALIDVNVSQLVVVPLLMPLVHYYNIDVVHFGVMIVLNMMIGLLTPPFGMLLFVTANVGKISLKALIRETMPLIGVELVALAIIAIFPKTVLLFAGFMK